MNVFIINLEQSLDRREAMNASLSSLGLEYSFFKAIDGKKLQDSYVSETYDSASTNKNLQRDLSISEIACALSHRALYQYIIDNNIEKACIMEDDILIDDQLTNILSNLDSTDIENMVVKLDNYQEKPTPVSFWHTKEILSGTFFKKPVTTQWMTWCYVIHRKACINILSTWPKINFAADDWKRMSRVIKLRCIQPAPAHSNNQIESLLSNERNQASKHLAKKKSINFPFFRIFYLTKTVLKMLLP